MVHFYPMGILNRLRERRIADIEREVNAITLRLEQIDPDEDMFQLGEDRELRERRVQLWLRRSDLVKKLPNEGET